MKSRLVLALAIVASLALAGVAAAQGGRSSAPPAFAVEPGVSSGAGYVLTGLAWEFEGAAEGGGYLLQPRAQSVDPPSACCCLFLPIMLKTY
jgi:hypothetical protein